MNISVGLDIGQKDVKAVELTSDLKVTKIGKIEIPRSIKGDENELYARKIRELFNIHKFSKDNVIISLRGSPILARTYLPPSKNKNDFERWFVDSIESLIPGTPIADVVYDHHFLKSGRALISFAKLDAVKNKIKILKACDIIPTAIDALCLALYHSFDNHTWIKEKKNFAILDVGMYNSDLLIVKEGEPYISTEIAFGIKDLKKGKDKYKVFTQKLAINLEKNFHYYKNKENLDIKELILISNYSNIPGLKKNLSKELGIKTKIEDPFHLRKIDLPDNFNHKTSLQYTQALGLALKGLNSKIGINLMPPEIKELRGIWEFNKKARKFFQKNIIISGIVFFIFLFLLNAVVRTNKKIVSEVESLKAKVSELSFVNTEEKELNSKIGKLRYLNNNPFLWSQMLSNLGNAVPEGMYLKTISTETRLVSVGSRPEEKTKVVIDGDARDNKTVLTFIKNLEKYFKNIAVNKMKEDIRCEFKISLTL